MKKMFNHEVTKARSIYFAKLMLRIFVASWFILCFPGTGASPPTQEEVFKSIGDNVGSSTDPKKFFAFWQVWPASSSC